MNEAIPEICDLSESTPRMLCSKQIYTVRIARSNVYIESVSKIFEVYEQNMMS